MSARPGMPAGRHGTLGGYTYWRCRCDECREANRQRMADYLPRLKAQPIPDEAHGKSSTYRNRGCRCAACLEAHMAKYRQWRGSSLTDLRQRRNQEVDQ